MAIGSDIGESSYGGMSAGLSDESWGDTGGYSLSGSYGGGGWGDSSGNSSGSFGSSGTSSWGSIDSSGNATLNQAYGDIADKLSTMSVADQEAFFRNVVDPLVSQTYDSTASTVGEYASKAIMSGLMNAIAPGLGTLVGLAGGTDTMYGWLQDSSFTQKLGEELGIYDSSMSAQDMLNQASQGGTSQSAINQALTNTVESLGMSNTAANTAASYQQQALDYLIEREALPRQYSEAALGQMAGALGLEGGTVSQDEFLTGLQSSPLYQSIMGGQEAGEESIMRQAGATGGLRSGNVQEALYDYNTQLERQALLDTYNQQMAGLTSMSGLPSYATSIADLTSGIGTTLAAGQTAEAQMEQDELAQWLNLGTSVLQSTGGVSGLLDVGSSIIDSIADWF